MQVLNHRTSNRNQFFNNSDFFQMVKVTVIINVKKYQKDILITERCIIWLAFEQILKSLVIKAEPAQPFLYWLWSRRFECSCFAQKELYHLPLSTDIKMLLITFTAKLHIFQRYFIQFFEILIRLDRRAKKACPAT